jgi:putative DNA primase/helicase
VARLQGLVGERPDPGDQEACQAHQQREISAGRAIMAADYAAEGYLRQHPGLVPVYGTARAMHDAGICVIPIGAAKRTVLESWREFQERRPDLDELHEWFCRDRDDRGLAVVCGQVSGGVEMLELEGRALREGILGEFTRYLAEAGLTEVWDRIAAGYREMSPSGGLHVLWRCEEIAGNTKLAARPATDAELAADPKHKVRDLIETRGEGGYVVIAPSPGGCHPSGKPWTLESGSPEKIATITPQQRERILTAARKCTTVPPGPPRRSPPPAAERDAKGKRMLAEGRRPRPIFTCKTSWAEILEPAGWALDSELTSGEKRWRRPGKAAGEGHSAVTGNPDYPGDNLFVFSSSTQFEPETPYDKFTAYAVLYHGGDLAEAETAVEQRGCRDERPILPPAETPLPAAEEIARLYYTDEAGNLLLRWHREDFYRRAETHWQIVPAADLRSELYRITGAARVAGKDEDTGEETYKPWNPNKTRIEYLTHALGLGIVHLDSSIEPGSWIEGAEDACLIPVANGLLNRDTRELRPHSPDCFNTWALPYAYNPDASPPRHLLKFLNEIFPGDQQSIDRLQEWTGYLVSGDTRFQKIGLLVGPPRAGKGTIMGLWEHLLGEVNCVSPTLFSLSGRFGQQQLIGKQLALFKDENFQGRSTDLAVAVTALKTISGAGDTTVTIDRKNKPSWTGRPTARLNIAANDRSPLKDASSALASRWYIFVFTKTWLDQEDEKLSERLHSELPSILNWALDGWERLRTRGRLIETEQTIAERAAMGDAGSPHKRFRDECLEAGPDYEVPRDLLWDAWKRWCSEEGERPETQAIFGMRLRSVIPGMSERNGAWVPGSNKTKRYPRRYIGFRLIESSVPGLRLVPRTGGGPAAPTLDAAEPAS